MRPNLVAGVEISNFLSANLAPFFTLDLITFFSMPFVFDNPDVVAIERPPVTVILARVCIPAKQR
jgi:hypothetical protein